MNLNFGKKDHTLKIRVMSEPQQDNLEEVIIEKLKNAIPTHSRIDMKIVPYTEQTFAQYLGTSSMVFFLINQKENVVGISITIIQNRKFLLNQLRLINFDPSKGLAEAIANDIDDVIKLALNVIQDRINTKKMSVTTTREPTISID